MLLVAVMTVMVFVVSSVAVARTIQGTNRADTLVGTNNSDRILARGGNDKVRARGGQDDIYGGRGRDLIYGGSGEDGVVGGRGNDALKDGPGPDYLVGGPGNDKLYGTAGDDGLVDYGLSSREVYKFSRNFGRDHVFDQGGDDVLDLRQYDRAEWVDLYWIDAAGDGDDARDDAVFVMSDGSEVVIYNYSDVFFPGPGYIETIRFADTTISD